MSKECFKHGISPWDLGLLVLIFRMNHLYIVKTTTKFVLFIIFLVVFGIPSIKRYFAKSVHTEIEGRKLIELKMPAITVCSRSI